MHSYRAFGVTIESELELPQLPEGRGMPDIRIRIARERDRTGAPATRAWDFRASPEEFFLEVDGVGRFRAAEGTTVTLEPDPAAHPDAVRIHLLGSVFGALLLQRGVLPLHGSAVTLDGTDCHVLAGKSGAGKSTLAAALATMGCGILSDDVCAVEFTPGGPVVHPSYPQQKLWRESLVMLGMETDAAPPLMPGCDKRSIAVAGSFRSEPLPLRSVCELLPVGDSPGEGGLRIRTVTGAGRMDTLLRHTYRFAFVAGLGLRGRHFTQCASLPPEIPVLQAARHAPRDTVHPLAERLFRFMSEPKQADGS